MLIHRLRFRMPIVVIRFIWGYTLNKQLPRWQSGQESACQYKRHNRTPVHSELGRSPGGGHGTPLQYSCLGNPMDRGAWWATECGVTKNQTWLSTHTHTHIPLKSWFLDYYTWQTTLKDILSVLNLKCRERIFALQNHFKKSFLEIILWPVEAFKAEFNIQKVIYLQLQKTIFLR